MSRGLGDVYKRQQLIIAALLMVLGVIIVYTSGRELFRKKEVREKSVGKTGIQAGA